MSSQVNLHSHTAYSFLDGYAKVGEVAQRAKELGQSYAAITDHGEVAGHLAFSKACREHDIGPVYGIEAYWTTDLDGCLSKKYRRLNEAPISHICLLAADNTGLSNLWALSSIAYDRDHHWYKPLADVELLRTYSAGVMASDGCLLTVFADLVDKGDEDGARQIYGTLLDIYGDRFYVELHTWQYIDPSGEGDVAEERRRLNLRMRELNHAKVQLATEMGIPMVVVNDSHHSWPAQWLNRELVWAFNTTKADDKLQAALGEMAQKADHHMAEDELYYWMGKHGISRDIVAEAIKNSYAIAESCKAHITPTLGVPRMGASDLDDLQTLMLICETAFQEKVSNRGLDEDRYYQRLETEMRLIAEKSFCFPAGTQVLSGDGTLVSIESVRPGDGVLTRQGVQPVGRALVREVDERLVVLGVAGSYRKLKATSNHPVLTSTGWKQLGEISVGDEVAVDTFPEGPDVPLDVLGLATQAGWAVQEDRGGFVRMGPGRWGTSRKKKGWCSAKLDPTPDLMYLVGLWIAEGHLYSPDGATCPGQVGWTLHRNESDVRARLQTSLTKLGFGQLRSYSKVAPCHPDHQGMAHMVTNHPLALVLQEIVGSGLHQKRLGPWLMSLSSEALAPLIQGWFDGDGNISLKGRKSIATSNATLAYQLRQLLLRSGVWATEIKFDNNGRPAYRVCWQDFRRKAPYGARRDGDRWWVKVKSVRDENFKGLVYNLSVAGDPTYVAEGIRVHNCGYFLMVRDYTMAFRSGSWAQYIEPGSPSRPLVVGPGRGSVGGSLVAYLCGIDIIDPLHYGTLFSRFISPGRKDLPDIDLDVPQSQRPAGVAYLTKRFGADKVCAIGTVNRNGAKATLRDLGRAMKIDRNDINAICEHIEQVERFKREALETNPDETDLTWEELIERKGGELAPYVAQYPKLFELAQEMVGLARHTSVHAAGILVSSEPLLGRIPLRTRKHNTEEEITTTAFDMHEVEQMGGVKNDLLGLRHLDTLAHARDLIYQRHHLWIDYDHTGLSIPEGCTDVLALGPEHFADPAIWDQIDQGQTTGVFQLETPTLTGAAIEFKSRSEVDVAVLTSIVRPGVSDAGLTKVFLRRRAGKEPVTFDHPMMEHFVGPKWSTDTYGILTFQEQLIRCVQELASFTDDEADDLRKAVGKKQMEKLQALKKKFVEGCLYNPEFMLPLMSERDPTTKAIQVANHIWASIEASGRYLFNWSHAVEYAWISTAEVWLKHYFPQEFLVALLQTDSGNVNRYIREARRKDIVILPPDVNLSEQKFTIEGEAIRYGLDSIRGVGEVACRDILEGRPYVSLEDFVRRSGKGANKTSVVGLIHIGAFDSIGSRDELLSQLERLRACEGLAESTLANAEKLEVTIARRLASGKYTIDRPDFSDPQVVREIEERLVGTLVTVDPLGRYVSSLDKCALRDPFDLVSMSTDEECIIGGEITAVRPTVTKKGRFPGQEMAHIIVNWNDAEFRITVWPEQWKDNKDLLTLKSPVGVQVKKLGGGGCCLQKVYRLDHLFDQEGRA